MKCGHFHEFPPEIFQKQLREAPQCMPCVKWRFQTTETWGLRFDDAQHNKLKPFKPIVTDAATWEPTNGLISSDSMFPHISYGFRNRTIPIATYHVISAYFF